VVEAIDIVTTDNPQLPQWLILEWLPLNLSNFEIDEASYPTALLQICLGLEYIHSKGIVHRDLKPGNILLQVEQQNLAVKIADFGEAKRNVLDVMTTFTGTGHYMAPELLTRPLAYTSAIDMWSLGIIALQLVTSWKPASSLPWKPSMPPSGKKHKHWVHAVVLPRIHCASAKYKPLLEGLLREDPEQRWSAKRACGWFLDTDFRSHRRPAKRSAPVLEETGGKRSNAPSVSTTRTKTKLHGTTAMVPLHNTWQEASSMPDTLSWANVASPTPAPSETLDSWYSAMSQIPALNDEDELSEAVTVVRRRSAASLTPAPEDGDSDAFNSWYSAMSQMSTFDVHDGSFEGTVASGLAGSESARR
jgi:serine/threonine protein kinase